MSFIDNKSACLYHQRIKAASLRWTQTWRRNHKKLKTETVMKRRAKKTVRVQRAVGGMSLDDFKKKKSEKPEVRQAAREAALRYVLFIFSLRISTIYFFSFLVIFLF